ncbi:hypothetical protein AVEN_25667-1 [Araneus ventricosus]|uniref:Uncharacterized protein n=1 Tax=Araneus ventricosus TaxID=182803 RepID=A0A4Y2BN61_ARAVE|nr:hypothetical protein AVEN_25667-1 [Araneus ventricosus]
MHYRVKLSQNGATNSRIDIMMIMALPAIEDPSLSTNAQIIARVNESILANKRVTMNEIANELVISLEYTNKIIVDHLEFHRVFAYPRDREGSRKYNQYDELQIIQSKLCVP